MTYNLRKGIKIAISFIFTFFILFIIFLNVSIGQIISAIKSISLKYIILGFVFHLGAHFFRSLVLFSFLKEEKVNMLYVLNVHFIHNFFVHLIPAGLGEFSFPYILKKRVGISKSISVLFISRALILLLTIILFLTSIFILFDFNKLFDINFTYPSLLLTLLIVGLSISGYLLKKLNKLSFFSNLTGKLKKLFETSRQDLKKLKEAGFLLKNVLFTLLGIFSAVLYYFCILKGLEIKLNLFQIIFVSSIGIVFVIFPIKSFGGFGTTEGSWAVGLMLFGYSKELSIQAGFAVHIYALVNVIFLFFVGIINNNFIAKKNLSHPFKN